jgi:hypothetical protein
MAVSMAATLRNNRLDQITSFAGSGALLKVYTTAGAVLLYTSTCAAALGAAASGGVLTANAIGNATAVAAGTAALARLYKSDGTTLVLDGLTVGTSGTNVIITNTVIAINDVITTSSLTITEGNP